MFACKTQCPRDRPDTVSCKTTNVPWQTRTRVACKTPCSVTDRILFACKDIHGPGWTDRTLFACKTPCSVTGPDISLIRKTALPPPWIISHKIIINYNSSRLPCMRFYINNHRLVHLQLVTDFVVSTNTFGRVCFQGKNSYVTRASIKLRST